MANVLICEDDALVAFDLAQSIEAAGHRIVGIYASARAVLEADCLPVPDTAIIDLRLADGHTGAALAQTLHESGARVIILSGHTNVNAGLGSFPYTYAAKPLSGILIRELLSLQQRGALRPQL